MEKEIIRNCFNDRFPLLNLFLKLAEYGNEGEVVL